LVTETYVNNSSRLLSYSKIVPKNVPKRVIFMQKNSNAPTTTRSWLRYCQFMLCDFANTSKCWIQWRL